MKARRNDVVSASEIASWAWCPEAWRLEARGQKPGNGEELARGETFHARASATEVWSRRAMTLGRWLIALALVAAICVALFKAVE